MSLPNVNISLTNGALGSQSESLDGIAAMVLTGVATAKLALNTPKVIYQLQDAIDLGITEAANPSAYRHIKEFYQGYNYIAASQIAELWIQLVVNTQTLTQSADILEENGASKLLDAAQGRVRLLGFARTPDEDYSLTLTDGIDADSLTALQKAHELGNTYFNQQAPVRCLVEGRSFEVATIGKLKDLKTYTYNRAACVLASSQNDGSASVGLVLGIAAALPVQRNIGRVLNGSLPISKMYIGDTDAATLSGIDSIDDKGYIIPRTFSTRSGYFLNGDHMAAAETDDYSSLANGRVIDKASTVTYDTYIATLNDDVEVDQSTGQIASGYLGYLESIITDAIIKQMDGNISGKPSVAIPANQNILANKKTNIQLKVTPKGYNKIIAVDLGFTNPANASA